MPHDAAAGRVPHCALRSFPTCEARTSAGTLSGSPTKVSHFSSASKDIRCERTLLSQSTRRSSKAWTAVDVSRAKDGAEKVRRADMEEAGNQATMTAHET